MRRLTTKIRAAAERTVTLTDADARAVPGMLGRLVAGALAEVGWYSCSVDGVRTLYIKA